MTRNDPKSGVVTWRVHCTSPPESVYGMLATPAGRSRFWARSAEQDGDSIEFRFPNGHVLQSRLLEDSPPNRYAITYFGGSHVAFELNPAPDGGTDLTLTESGIPEGEYLDNLPGWVSVLLTLKAAVDHGIDLRNNEPPRTWENGFVDP